MGVNYLYCGECQESYNSQDFDQCHQCCEIFKHPREGYYCGLADHKYEHVMHENRKYCVDCYDNYITKVKCSVCKQKKMKKKFRDCNNCFAKLNYKKSKVYVCKECDDDFLCKKCDDGLYFCNMKCSNGYRVMVRRHREEDRKRKEEQKKDSDGRMEAAKKIAIKFDESKWETYHKFCVKCKIFPCECDLIEGQKRLEYAKKVARKFDESKWNVYHSCLCAECNIFPCECSK